MPPFNHFTTKAKEAVRKAHELAIERGQNHVSPLHLLAALLLQDESPVVSMLERLEIDAGLLAETVLESIEAPDASSVLSPSYQLYLTPELVQTLERSSKAAAELHDEFVREGGPGRLLDPFMPDTSAAIKKAVLENSKPASLFPRKE